MIWAGEVAYLEALELRVCYVADLRCYDSWVLRRVLPSDGVLPVHVGDIWLGHQRDREHSPKTPRIVGAFSCRSRSGSPRQSGPVRSTNVSAGTRTSCSWSETRRVRPALRATCPTSTAATAGTWRWAGRRPRGWVSTREPGVLVLARSDTRAPPGSGNWTSSTPWAGPPRSRTGPATASTGSAGDRRASSRGSRTDSDRSAARCSSAHCCERASPESTGRTSAAASRCSAAVGPSCSTVCTRTCSPYCSASTT